MPAFWIELKGLREIEAKLNAKIAKMKQGSVTGLLRAGTEVIHDSKAIAPVVSGDLQESGRMEPTVTSEGVTVKLIFDPVSKTSGWHYAAWAHEWPTGQHPKYLENVLRDKEQRILDLIADGARSGI